MQARYKIYAPCAVIAESRCLASKSFEQNSVNDPVNGIVGTFEPLGAALLESEEDEEIDVLIGSHIRRAVVKKIEREPPADHPNTYANRHVEERPIQQEETILHGSTRSENSENRSSVQPKKPVSEVSETQSSGQRHRLRPDEFHDPDYRLILRNLGLDIIDRIGPISHRDLCQKIARMHDFQRTGAQIRKTVWAAVHNERQSQKDASGKVVFWPNHQEPRKVVDFRGLNLDGEERAWKYVPYSEKLGLALEAVKVRSQKSPMDHMVYRLGLKRLTAPTRAELEELISQAREIMDVDGDASLD